MDEANQALWLFDYDDGKAYDNFSQCEDYKNQIAKFLTRHYDFSNQEALEIGAGSGKFTTMLASECKFLHVVERSNSLLSINRKRNHKKNIRFYLQDVKDLIFPDNSVDLIFGGWSMTSMRDSFEKIIPVLQKVLKDTGKIILVENAGNDEFSRLVNIETLSFEMLNLYQEMGFSEKTILDTVICLPNRETFYDAFPNQSDVPLPSLAIEHKVAILESDAKSFKQGEDHGDC